MAFDRSGDGESRPHLCTMLFDLLADPGQMRPLDDGAVEAMAISRLVASMRANDAPAEQYERLGLPQP